MNETIFTFEKLYQAYLDCRRTKRNTTNALRFEWSLEKNLFQLQKELKAKRYKPGRSICFVVTEPSPREIFAANFRDRIVHHLLINEIEDMGERSFIFDVHSCRKNKGTHLAIERLKRFIRKITENYKNEASYLQLDISGFFMAIDHNILYSLFKKLILKQNKSYQWEKDILWLAKTIIFYKPTKNYISKGNPSLFKLIPPRKSLFESSEEKGLPIGNYSSQFFANLYLNQLDQFIKRELRCEYYIRYADDLVLLDKNRGKLRHLEDKIQLFLEEELSLKLNQGKIKLQSINRGIDFLGYFIKPEYTLIRQRVVKKLEDKLYQLDQSSDSKLKLSDLKILAMINSYYGHFKHAFSFNLRKNIYENRLGKMQTRFLPKLNYSFLKIK
jgi:hypothetical protein